MTAEMDCDQVKELAPELALGIVAGEERDLALRHLAECPACRGLVSELSSVGEDLLLLAPTQEPPPGFETGVLDALAQQAPTPRVTPLRPRRRWVAAMAVAAAVVAAAAIGTGSTFLATGEDRMLAEGYRAVLREGQGSFFTAAPLLGPEGRVGTVFGYEGNPSWIVVTLQEPGSEEDSLQARIVTRDRRYLVIGDAVLGQNQAWGHQLPVELSAVQEVRFVGSDGRTVLTAGFGPANTWD
jgi:Putative zinc-finger